MPPSLVLENKPLRAVRWWNVLRLHDRETACGCASGKLWSQMVLGLKLPLKIKVSRGKEGRKSLPLPAPDFKTKL